MANNALAPNIDNVLSDYAYAGRKLKEQRTNNMLNPQVQAALNYIKSTGQKFISLDTPQDMSTGETLTDIGLGFVPVVGTAQGARDFERARRENDYLGMGLSAASMLPFVGGVVKAGEKVAKGSKLVKAVEELIPEAQRAENLQQFMTKAHPELFTSEGKAKTLYHATDKDFDVFDTSIAKGKTFGTGIWMAETPAHANTYATGANPHVMPLHVNLQNPVVIDAGGANWNGLHKNVKISTPKITVSDVENENLLAQLTGAEPNQTATKTLKEQKSTLGKLFKDEFQYGDETFSTDDLARWARKQGYDGVIFKNVKDQGPAGRFATEASSKPGNVYVAFKPEQMKSAIGNVGTFDPKKAAITAGIAAPVAGAALLMNQDENNY